MASKTGATARVPAGMASTAAQSLASLPTCHGGEAKRDTTPTLGSHPACGCSRRHPSQRLRSTRTALEVATAEAPEPADDASDALPRRAPQSTCTIGQKCGRNRIGALGLAAWRCQRTRCGDGCDGQQGGPGSRRTGVRFFHEPGNGIGARRGIPAEARRWGRPLARLLI